MINAAAFEGLKVRATGDTARNIKVAVWGAVFGRTSVIYAPTQQIAKYIEAGLQQECVANSLNYSHIRSKIHVRVPETRGLRPDMILIDNSMQTAFYEQQEVGFE